MKKNHLTIILVLGLVGVLSIPFLMIGLNLAPRVVSPDQFLMTVAIGLAAIIAALYSVMWKLKPWK